MKTKLRNEKGFTIIEVLIVLAIAGLILLIVFLAVPALQRNSRNTQRKNDVAALLAGVAEYANNNSGNLPTAAPTQPNPGVVQWNGAAGTTSSQAKVGYYTAGIGAGSGQVQLAAAGTVIGANVYATAPFDRVTVTAQTQCNADNSTAAGAARSVTAVYAIENGSGTFAQACQGS